MSQTKLAFSFFLILFLAFVSCNTEASGDEADETTIIGILSSDASSGFDTSESGSGESSTPTNDMQTTATNSIDVCGSAKSCSFSILVLVLAILSVLTNQVIRR